MWKAVETEAEKTRMAKTIGRRGKRENKKEIRRESRKTEIEIEKRKNNGSEESSGRIEDLE